MQCTNFTRVVQYCHRNSFLSGARSSRAASSPSPVHFVASADRFAALPRRPFFAARRGLLSFGSCCCLAACALPGHYHCSRVARREAIAPARTLRRTQAIFNGVRVLPSLSHLHICSSRTEIRIARFLLLRLVSLSPLTFAIGDVDENGRQFIGETEAVAKCSLLRKRTQMWQNRRTARQKAKRPNENARFHQICARDEDASDGFRAAACTLAALMTFEIARKYESRGESNAPHPIHSYAFV